MDRGRSRTTLWRRKGAKRTKYFQDSDDDEQVADENVEVENDDENVLEIPEMENISCSLFENRREADDVEGGGSDGDSDVLEELAVYENILPIDDDGDDNDDDAAFVPYAQQENDDHESDSEVQTFNFDHPKLDIILNFNAVRTFREMLLLDLALAVRHHWTYESLIDHFSAKNVLFNCKVFPQSKRQLWRLCGFKGIAKHAYCSCGFYLEKVTKNTPETVNCQGCDTNINIREAKFFYRLSIRAQLKALLCNPVMRDVLKFYRNHKKQDEAAIEDFFDGEVFKNLQGTVMGPSDFVYAFNTDGCKISKGARTEIYPLFIRLLLPPNLRQKFIVLAGVLCDTEQPNLNAFLMSVVKELNSLSAEGISWCSEGEEDVITSKFFPLCFCVDGKARWQILNMSPHQAYYGCTSCTIKGVFMDNTMRYPSGPHEDLPPYEDRTHQGMLNDMSEAVIQKQPVRGHRGATPLALLKHFDLVEQGAFDDLHFLYECAAAVNFDLLMKVAPRVKDVHNREMANTVMDSVINARLAGIKTPSVIARKPHVLKIGNRAQWHASDWRNMLLYYGVPCLEGVIQSSHVKHFSMLSEVAFIMAKDSIKQEDLTRAERLIERWLSLFDQFYGLGRTRLNLHSLRHAVKSIKLLGPLRSYSTFNFESWNHNVLLNIKSPNAPVLQLATRHVLRMYLELAMVGNNDIADDVKNELKRILGRKVHAHALPVGDHMYALGKPVVRAPTANEAEVLARENIFSGELSIFERLLISGTTYQPKNSVKGWSDNSTVYTKENTFCTIEKIILVSHGGANICGLFVIEHDVLPRPFMEAHHIVHLQTGGELAHFLRADMIKCPVVKVPINHELYVIPVPNMEEID